MGMRNTLDMKEGGAAPPIDKALGTAYDAVKSVADKLPVIEYLEKNVDRVVADMQSAEAVAVAAEHEATAQAAQALVSQTAAAASEQAASASELAAAQSEVAAAESAATATTQAQASAASEAAAHLSETNAGASESAAAASEAAALASAQAAAASETNAGHSETAAAASAGSASTDRAAAELAESNAATSETNASASAAAALASQDAAKTSETNSKASETAAGISAAGASSSLAQAQAIVRSMNALYLGSKSADPAVDNNGDALIVGAEYFNTASNQLRVYTSTGWQDQDATAETMAANATASASAAAGSAAAAGASASGASTSETNAAASAAEANDSKVAAAASEANAGGSAVAAQTARTGAETAESNASASSTQAGSYAATAQNWAAQMGGTVDGTSYSAKYYAAQAAASAAAIALPIPVASGGTGSTTAADARTALGAASTGANSYTGNQTVSVANAAVSIDDSGGAASASLYFKNAGVNMWRVNKDASQNFTVVRYAAGSLAEIPLSISTAGVVSLTQRPVFGTATPWDSANFTPGNYLPLAGGTMTGTLSVSYSTPTLTLNDTSAANQARILFQSNGTPLWNLHSGSSSGGLALDRYASGAYADSPLTFSPAGVATLTQRPVFGPNTPWDSGNLNPASYLPLAGGAMTGALSLAYANPALTLNAAAAGQTRWIGYQTNGSQRWYEGVDNSAESGSNAGSNWLLGRYTDAGVLIDQPIVVNRATGVAALSQRPTFAGNTPFDTGNLSSFLSGRNRIINGDCRVAQRASTAYAAGYGGYGGPDRYFCNNTGATGATLTQSQGSLVYNGITIPTVQQTITVAATSLGGTTSISGIQQRVEANDSYDLPGRSVALSFLFKAAIAGTYSVAVAYLNGTSAYTYTSTFDYATAGAVQPVQLAVPAAPAGAAFAASTSIGAIVYIGALQTGTYSTSTLNTWQLAASITYAAYASATNWAATAGNYIAATNIQLESGAITTPFERRSYAEEFARSQRYYQIITDQMVAGYTNAGNQAWADVTYPVPMRVTPAVTIGSITYSNASGYVLNTVTPNKARFNVVVTATGMGFGYGGLLTFNAEL
jgi:hypothetical protein